MRILEVAEEPLAACYGDEGVSDTPPKSYCR